jgi:hypothetical protein
MLQRGFDGSNYYVLLKVSKFQKQIFLFSFEPKMNDFFLNSALASKMSQKKMKVFYHIN